MLQCKSTRKRLDLLVCGICIFLLLIGFLCFFAGRWYIETYGALGFDSILYTLTASLDGVQIDLILSFAQHVLLWMAIAMFAACFLLFPYTHKVQIVMTIGKKIRFRLMPMNRAAAAVISIVLSSVLIYTAAMETGFVTLIKNGSAFSEPSSFYEDYYVDPRDVSITFPEKKKNLIFIFLESMETTFFSQEQLGAMETNVIPELYRLAQENVNFSHNEDVGGFFSAAGTTWTMGGLLAQTAGLPLKTPPGVNVNSYGEEGVFLPGVYTLNDILAEHGYKQAMMFGSDANFCGRYQYFINHGMNESYDYYTAMADGIIPQDYHVWWGMEDAYLYTYARQELTELAAGDQPFSFTMLTVDTHHIGGYRCTYCQHEYEEQYEDVYRCASRQLSDFLQWLQQQDFYEDTTIVISGDHPSMDAGYFSRQVPENYDRRMYNCFINAALQPENTKNRLFSSLDMFPTVLAAMGCTIEGEQLGLGVNMFSGQKTLAEQLGSDMLNHESARYSPFYAENFF